MDSGATQPQTLAQTNSENPNSQSKGRRVRKPPPPVPGQHLHEISELVPLLLKLKFRFKVLLNDLKQFIMVLCTLQL
jgi:hypothetical protein